MPGDIGSAFMAPLQEGAQINAQNAQTQLAQIESAQRLMAMRDQQQMRQMVSTLAKQPGSPSELLDKAGTAALNAGMLEQAERAFSHSGLLQQRSAHALEYKARAEDRAIQTEMRTVGQLINHLGMYDDSQEGWEQGKLAYLASHPKPGSQELQLLQLPWRKGLGDILQKSLMSAKDRYTVEHQQRLDNLRQLQEAARERHQDVMEKNAEARLRVEQSRVDRMNKTGGSKGPQAAGRPTLLDRQDAQGLIQEYVSAQGWDALPSRTLEQFGLEIASRARAIASQSPETEWDEALQQAFEENSGRLGSVAGTWPWSKDAASVTPKTKAPAKTEFVEGQVYKDANGNKAKYVNGSWLPVEETQ